MSRGREAGRAASTSGSSPIRSFLRLAASLGLAVLSIAGARAVGASEGASEMGAGAGDQRARVERLHIDDVLVVSPEEGTTAVELYVRAETRSGVPVRGIASSMLGVRDNGKAIAQSRVEVSHLGQTDRGATFVFAIDASAKMRGAPFESARAAVFTTTLQMGPNDRIAVLTFADRVEVAIAFETPRNEWRTRIDALGANPDVNESLVLEGAFKAVQMIRGASDLPRRQLAIVFSDGKDDGSRATLDEVVDLANGEGMLGRVPIFTIGFDRLGGGDLNALSALALATGAEAFSAQSTDLIAGYFDRIRRQVFESYVVRYPAKNDGGHHSIEVSVGRQADTLSVAFPAPRSRGGSWVVAASVLLVAVLVAYAWWRWARARRAGRVLFLTGPRKGETIAIAGSIMSIGALPDNDVVISSPAVSRYHAQLRRKGGRLMVMDVGSVNGTFVNGTAIKQCALEPGDLIRIGDVELAYEG